MENMSNVGTPVAPINTSNVEAFQSVQQQGIVAPNLAGPKVTTIQDIQRYAQGAIIELPGFGPNQPFIVKMKRPSMMNMATEGRIPNELLVKANQLFANGTGSLDDKDPGMLKEFKEVIDTIVEATLIEPSYHDIKAAGMELTDEQLMAIFGYVQNGVKSLENFRNE